MTRGRPINFDQSESDISKRIVPLVYDADDFLVRVALALGDVEKLHFR